MQTSMGRAGESFWVSTAQETAFPSLSGDAEADVAVVGGGIAGLTAAALLKQAGRSVAVIEALRVGSGATGRSTAKVTSQHGLIYGKLVRKHGDAGARSYAAANQAAIERVENFVHELEISCQFERKSAYVYTCSADRVGAVEEEAECARRLGLPAALDHEPPLPFPVEAAVRFTDQAQFHPCKYLAGLAGYVEGDGSHVFENTRATGVETGSPMRVRTERGTVTARDVIVATQLPVTAAGMFFAKAYPHTEPVLAALIEPAQAPDGMFMSADEPTLSVIGTSDGDRTYLVAAGGAYTPGHGADASESLAALERDVREHFAVRDIGYRWTNHDYWPMDVVPFVGRATSVEEHLFVATGFQAWGLSNGTAAGMMLADTITGQQNPWATLFDAARVKPMASASAFVSGNVHVAGHLVGGYLSRKSGSPREMEPGDAGVFSTKGRHVAAYRDETGVLHEVSAVCTHMKCVVGWNPTDRTWDCPCHGSRFAVDGTVLSGPAVHPLSAAAGTEPATAADAKKTS